MGARAILSDLLGSMNQPTHARRALAELARTATLPEDRAPVEAGVIFEPMAGTVITASDFSSLYVDKCPAMPTGAAQRRLGHDPERERPLRPPSAPPEPRP